MKKRNGGTGKLKNKSILQERPLGLILKLKMAVKYYMTTVS